MLKKLLATAVVAATAFVLSDPAHAFGPGGFARNLTDAPTMRLVISGERVASSDAKLCADAQEDCLAIERPYTFVLTSYRESQLKRVNATVNASVRLINDFFSFGRRDVLKISSPVNFGSDLAGAKRAMLIAMGWSPEALTIATGRTADGERRVVLVVTTNKGDYALDDRSNAIKKWKRVEIPTASIRPMGL
ncbi:transglutaminase-like cysteine peptidase [Rhizobium cremeum]|uniref:transglutaminase-like cysteine peptidase n=1 Tax=Rhizobium cremeum TaxID=2813827 RepID=UPI000DDE8318